MKCVKIYDPYTDPIVLRMTDDQAAQLIENYSPVADEPQPHYVPKHTWKATGRQYLTRKGQITKPITMEKAS